MATFYVRKTGSDANAGTSAAAAFLTIGKLLGATGMASGDQAYIGAGVYRETVSVAMTSAVAETKIYGDVTGAFTGDPGEVILTAYTTNDTTAPSATTLLNLNTRDFLTFQDIVFIGGGATIVTASTSVSTDIKFTRCAFITGGTGVSAAIVHTTAANTAANWTIDSCIFLKSFNTNIITWTLTRPATADFNYNILIKNCFFIGGSGTSVSITASGANTFNGGGVTIYNCTHIGAGALMAVTSANVSTTIPCNVYNCFVYNGAVALNANTLGQIVEDYNNMISGASPRTNVTAGTHSTSDGSYSPLFFTGIEYIQRGIQRPFGMPKEGSPILGYGNQAGAPTVDILNRPRPTGTVIISPPYVTSDYGTATSGGAKTLTNTNKAWGTNAFAGYTVYIVSGTGSGQTKTISSNTATVLTVDGNWITQPDSTSVYQIYLRETATTGTATAGSTTTLTDSNAAWGVNSWAGFTLSIDTGTSSPQTMVITSNTATVLTFPVVGTAPDGTSTYSLYRATSTTTINPSVGAYEGNLITPAIYPLKREARRKVNLH